MKREKKSVKELGKLNEKEKKKILFAFLATFLSVVGAIITIIFKREDEYALFYAKQSLIIFVVGAVAGAISPIFLSIPIIGRIINFALTFIVFLIWVLSWIFALSGKEIDVPIVGNYARKIKI